MRLLIELLAAASSDSSGGGFSVQATLSLVAGSTVLGGIIGAYVQSSRQREEKFRERMIEASVGFLSVIGDAQRAATREAIRRAAIARAATAELVAASRELRAQTAEIKRRIALRRAAAVMPADAQVGFKLDSAGD